MNEDHPLHGFEDDIRHHLELETRENIERGMTPEAARLAALRKFGNVGLVMEDTRAVWRWTWLEQVLQDARYGLRFLRRNPRFAAGVTLTMALGIGINTAVFSVVNTVLLKAVSYPDADRLVWIGAYDARMRRDYASKEDFPVWRKDARSFALMAEYGYQQVALVTPRGASQITAIYVGGDFWKMTGVQPAMGRLFGDELDGAVLSWDFFQREFGGNPGVVGSTVVMNTRPVRIHGVLPAWFRFEFPMWWAASHPEPVAAYLTVPRRGEGLAQSTLAVGMLRAGVSTGQADAELRTIEEHILAARGDQNDGMKHVRVEPLAVQLAGGSERALMVLLAAGAFVLLIAVVNVANLLLARASLRYKEIAIRAAVGAGRSRVLRQLLVESAVQAIAGGACGLVLARWALAVLTGISPRAVPRLSQAAIDGRVLAFTLLLSLLAGAIFALAPAMALRDCAFSGPLKSGGRNSAAAGGLRVRRALVGVELALAIVLLSGAALMLKSYARMNARAPGFDPEHVLRMNVRFWGPAYRDDAAPRRYVRELLGKLAAIPGVRASGVSCWIAGREQPFFFHVNAISQGYPAALGMRLLKGRWLNPADKRGVMLNDSMARMVFGDAEPIGRQLKIPRVVTVVGVVADLKYSQLDAATPPEAYLNIDEAPDLFGVEVATLAWKDPAALISPVRSALAEIDPSLPL